MTGHRGHGGDFPTGTEPEIFTFRRSAVGTDRSVPLLSTLPQSAREIYGVASSIGGEKKEGEGEGQQEDYVELQAPSYIHEVHLLAESMVTDLIDLEKRARDGVKLIIAHFEEEEERERASGGAERVQMLDAIRLEKQSLPVRRRYRTQEDRDSMTAAKLAMGDIEGPSPRGDDVIISSSDSDKDSDTFSVESTGSGSGSGSGSADGITAVIPLDCITDTDSIPVYGPIVSTGRHASSVWAVNLVDVYTCPKTLQISHAFQVTYCSMTRPLGRTVADTYRRRIERDLPAYLGMVPRVVKHGGLVSLSYPWYVTAAVKTHLALASSSTVTSSSSSGSSGSTDSTGSLAVGDEESNGEKVDISDLSVILRELEREERSAGNALENSSSGSGSNVDAPDNNRENIRTIARTLWKKRVGVLMQSTSLTGGVP